MFLDYLIAAIASFFSAWGCLLVINSWDVSKKCPKGALNVEKTLDSNLLAQSCDINNKVLLPLRLFHLPVTFRLLQLEGDK
jgi:hypothetical protein